MSPPDAVAAEAVLVRVKLPRRLIAPLQGESLLNDAAGLVLFRMAVDAASRHPDGTERHPRLREQQRYRSRIAAAYAGGGVAKTYQPLRI